MYKELELNMDTEENLKITVEHSDKKTLDAFIELIEDCLPNSMSLYRSDTRKTSNMTDLICSALKRKEFKSGFIILEVETGEDKVFQGIEMIAADFRGDNVGLAKRFFEENGEDMEIIESDFLTTFVELVRSSSCYWR